MELFHQKIDNLKSVLSSYSIDDATTKQTIKEVFEKYHYTLDPHGAVGYYALNKYLSEDVGQRPTSAHRSPSAKGIFLETAHPVKFPETVEEVTNTKIEIPESVQYLLNRKKQSIKMDASFEQLKEWLVR
jgi:threonine synthase